MATFFALLESRAADVESNWLAMPMTQLTEAAKAGDSRAQFACWQREMALADSPSPVQDVIRSNFQRMTPRQIEDYLKVMPQRRMQWSFKSMDEVNQAVKDGNLDAAYFLLDKVNSEQGQHMNNAYSWLLKASDQRFAPAETLAALMYLRLYGVALGPVDHEKGTALLRDAADQDYSLAQSQLANLYFRGELIPPDIKLAVKYYREASDKGAPNAEYHLAELYSNGYGIPRDNGDTPVELLRKSAASNNVMALQTLGERYRIGLGVPVDYVQAARYYLKARQFSDNQNYSQSDLGADFVQALDSGLEPQPEVEREFIPFVKMLGRYLKATTRRDSGAMAQIGQAYLGGRFVPRDLVEAYRWFRLAAQYGAVDASTHCDQIKKMLTPEQMDKAVVPLSDVSPHRSAY